MPSQPPQPMRSQPPHQTLPVDAYLNGIVQLLGTHSNLVISAAPGAGKTTRVPVALANADWLSGDHQQIWVLEPRRIAARAAAERIASENGWHVGTEVGYQVRFENKIDPARTRIVFMTEAILERRLLHNPELKGIGAVILDEFHERNLHTDLTLALLKELQEAFRPDLRLVVMSATLDRTPLKKYLDNCPDIEVPGLNYPTQVFFDSEAMLLETGQRFESRVGQKLIQLIKNSLASRGDILAFLPGVGEIERVARIVHDDCVQARVELCKLHGQVSLEAQSRVVQKSDQRRLILATNIAETSLTLDGVATVVDTGLAKSLLHDDWGYSRLQLGRISRSSATQRAGRASRQQEGMVYKLYNRQDEMAMNEFDAAEIHTADITDSVLLLASLGIQNPASLNWFEAPREESLKAALSALKALELIDQDQRITKLGHHALALPLPVRSARLCLAGIETGKPVLATLLACLLAERDWVRDPNQLQSHAHLDCDLEARLQFYLDLSDTEISRMKSVDGFQRAVRDCNTNITKLQGIARSTDQRDSRKRIEEYSSEELTELLLAAFPDRIAKRRRAGESNVLFLDGSGGTLNRSSLCQQSEYLICLQAVAHRASTGGATDLQIYWARPLSKALLERHFHAQITTRAELKMNKEKNQVYLETAKWLKALRLNEGALRQPTKDELSELLPSLITNQWEEWLKTSEPAQNFLRRLGLAITYASHLEWPHPSELHAQAQAMIGIGAATWTEVQQRDLVQYLKMGLSEPLLVWLDTHLPESAFVPSGRHVAINYTGDAPTLSIRIQEIFGWDEVPTLAGGKLQLVLELLGPNFRPVQITRDLPSFWSSGYQDVRRELRIRYPKHQWPENPADGRPEAKGRRRN